MKQVALKEAANYFFKLFAKYLLMKFSVHFIAGNLLLKALPSP